jgi:NAD(P)-dependent dehydrogenase (short-subunit alcohol dehydrogenase family)
LAIQAYGPVDVLVIDAGIGVICVSETTPMATVREVFETNASTACLRCWLSPLSPVTARR